MRKFMKSGNLKRVKRYKYWGKNISIDDLQLIESSGLDDMRLIIVTFLVKNVQLW